MRSSAQKSHRLRLPYHRIDRFKVIINTILIVFSVVVLIVSLTWPPFADLGYNLAAGSIWTLFTILILDQITQRSQHMQTQAIRFLSYQDSNAALNLVNTLWVNFVKTFNPTIYRTHQKNLTYLYEPQLVKETLHFIDFDAPCPFATNWHSYLRYQLDKIQKALIKAQRYDAYISNDLVYTIGELSNLHTFDHIHLNPTDSTLKPEMQTDIFQDFPKILRFHYLLEQESIEFAKAKMEDYSPVIEINSLQLLEKYLQY